MRGLLPPRRTERSRRRLHRPAARRGQMIGMEMRVDDVAYAHSGVVCGTQITLEVTDWIDDRRSRMPGASKQIGNGNGILMQILPENHQLSLMLSGWRRSHIV